MSREENSQSLVFEGLKVVELSQGMSGPLACQLLADNGASVVKIEPPTGDWARDMPGFRMWNRGKQGVVLDLSTPEGKEQALALVDEADVLVESMRGGTALALGLDANQLRARNPRLVHCKITGFGMAEKWEKLPSYEGIVATRIGRWMGVDRLSGMSEINRGPRPVFNITPFGSYGCACLVLAEIFSAGDADSWAEHLLAAGGPAMRADENTFEEFLVENVPHHPMTHPAFSDYWRRGPVIRLDTCDAAPITGAPSLGEHTEALLAELGYSVEESAALIAAGAVKAAQGGKP